MTLPSAVTANLWTESGPAKSDLAPAAAKWGARKGLPHSQAALPFAAPIDPKRWDHSGVGYGVLLPDSDDAALTPAAKAAGEDAPEPVRRLLAARPGTVVLRWRKELGDRFLRRYFEDGSSQDPLVGLSEFGTGRGRLPRYVLIVGGPDVVPWSVQYALSVRHAVGRLPFTDERLAHYVDALLSEWSDGEADAKAGLLWSVDHGGGDITTLMRAALTKPLFAALDGTLPKVRHLTDHAATGGDLLGALSDTKPALVVTSSHGKGSPVDDPDAMRATLGLPVDAGLTHVDLDELDTAMPAGAVWYAQACCSAGGAGTSSYEGLLQEGTNAAMALDAVAGLGPMVAPAPLRLLGRERPVRAVLGHVEPTFDWTLRSTETGQLLGRDVVNALSSNLFSGQPLGLAFDDYREGVGVLNTQWADRREQLAAGDVTVRETLTRLRLTAIDRQSMVLLGDPTVSLPPLV